MMSDFDKQRPAFGFDLDGTLFSIKLILKRFSQITGKEMSFENMTKYSMAETFGLTEDQEYEIFSKIKDDVNLNSKPLKKTVELTHRLAAQNCPIIIITARRQNAFEETSKALELAGIKYDQIFMNANEKADIIMENNIGRYFDDQGQLIEKMMDHPVSKSCEMTLIDAPYNQGFNCDSRMFV
ncbi:haloacid dehalogenase [Companilactobacillus mishanensis]|uniref:haloacid dehalogenase n=1 Tax=Companilactobacillus mishanensis TaxID=2486008 RepID=UPI001EE94ECF|nr:haloacid dehalogenase [Companilactobacillus mishanensis]